MRIMGILIPEDNTQPPRLVDAGDYAENIKEVLEVRSFDMTVLPGRTLSLYFDAEGAYKVGAVMNERASTFFYQESNHLAGVSEVSETLPREAMIFGPVLVLGGPDSQGLDTSVGAEYIERII